MSSQENQYPESLTRKQKDILEDLEGLRARLKEFDHLPAEKMEELFKDEAIAQIFKEYERVILKALRAKIDEHLPKEDRFWDMLYRWVLNSRILGKRASLRKARRRLETGVKRPLKKKEAELLHAVEEIRYGRRNNTAFHVSEDELSSLLSLEDIIQRVNERLVFDPENPPKEERPTQWTQVRRILRKRKKIKMSRQALLRKIKRLQK